MVQWIFLNFPRMPEEPTLLWAMSVAIATLAGVIVYMYLKNEKKEIAKEKLLIKNAADMQNILEKTLVLFSGVEKSIIELNHDNKDSIISEIRNSNMAIIKEIQDTLKR